MRVQLVNKLNMYQAVELVCDEHQDAWNMIPAFVQTVQLLTEKLDTFKHQAYLHTHATIGVRETKDEERMLVIKKAEIIAGALRSLSTLEGDTKLSTLLRFSHSHLVQSNATRLQQYLDNITDIATAHITELSDYGVSQAKLEELQLLCNQLEQTLLKTRNAIVVRRSLSTEMELLAHDIDKLLKLSLDQLMLGVESDHPEFYRQYKAAREIVDYKGKSNKPKPPHTPKQD